MKSRLSIQASSRRIPCSRGIKLFRSKGENSGGRRTIRRESNPAIPLGDKLFRGPDRARQDRSIVLPCPDNSARAETDANRFVGSFSTAIGTDRSPTSSKIPLLLRFSLPFSRYATHIYGLVLFHVWRKIKRGFLCFYPYAYSSLHPLYLAFRFRIRESDSCLKWIEKTEGENWTLSRVCLLAYELL